MLRLPGLVCRLQKGFHLAKKQVSLNVMPLQPRNLKKWLEPGSAPVGHSLTAFVGEGATCSAACSCQAFNQAKPNHPSEEQMEINESMEKTEQTSLQREQHSLYRTPKIMWINLFCRQYSYFGNFIVYSIKFYFKCCLDSVHAPGIYHSVTLSILLL